ncbi:MAG: DUF423 domain-containing protein [Cyclobacteriaceae bacterium]|nr:DUF423 domain-containing protein [Cyclobacteriaceae bacterium]
MKTSLLFRIAAMLGALAVALGAFGAHALKELLIQNQREDTFELAVRYHFYHVFALALTAVLTLYYQSNRLYLAAWLFFAGIFLFSGSLYVLSLFNIRQVALITPVGGISFVAGWLVLFSAFTKKAAPKKSSLQ